MPITPSAVLQYRVNGGPVLTGATQCNPGDVLSFSAASYAGWGAPATRWEIRGYPPSWPTPAGWTYDASDGSYYYLSNNSSITPPNITLPSSGDVTAGLWGKWLFGLYVLGKGSGIFDESGAVELLSPSGLHDTGTHEGGQFDQFRDWALGVQLNWRKVDGFISSSIGGGVVLGSGTPASVNASAATQGVLVTAARFDHTHQVLTGNPVALGTALAPGSGPNLALADHVHTLPFSVLQAVLAAASGAVSFNDQNITNVGTPAAGSSNAATAAYAEGLVYALPWKGVVRGASLANQSLSGALTEDGITYQSGDLYLAKNQTTPAQNGVWVVNTTGAWTRATWFATSAQVIPGSIIYVLSGTANGASGWALSTTGAITVGTTGLTFLQVFGAHNTWTAGNGIDSTALSTGTIQVLLGGDGSLTFAGGGVQVGVLATDVQHGNRGGGSLHALAIGGSPGTAGFISGVDQAALTSRTVSPTASAMVVRGSGGEAAFAWIENATSGVAASGFIRLTNVGQAAIAQQSSVNAAHDVAAIGFDGSDSVLLGGQYAIWITATSENGFRFQDSGAVARFAVDVLNTKVLLGYELDAGSNNLINVTAILAPGTVASAGFIRLPVSTTAIAFRNAADTADLSALAVDGANGLSIGDGTNGTGYVTINVHGSGVLVKDNGTEVFAADKGTSQLRLGFPAILWGSGVASPSIRQTQVPSTGAAAGQNLTIQAQQGQNVSGGTNNSGGKLTLAGGLPGTGGTGGAQGDVAVQGANINLEGVLGWGGPASLATATTGPGAQAALYSPISIPSNSAFTWRATFTGKIVGPTTVVLFHQEFAFQVGDYGSLAFNTGLGGIDATSTWKIASPTQPWSTTTGVLNSLNVTAVADDGSGRCQLTVSSIGSVRQGSTVLIANVIPGCNGPRYVESVVGNSFVLRGTTYSAGYTSGGTAVVQACVTTGGATNPLQFYANGLEAAKWTAGETVSAGDLRQTNANDVYLYTHGGVVDGATAPSAHANSVTDGTATCDYLGNGASVPSIYWQLTKLEQIQM